MEDCPTPDGHDPVSVYETVETTLANEDYRDRTIEIRVYGGKSEITETLRREYLYAGVYYPPEVSGGPCARVNQMLIDILIWTIDHPEPSNLMVIAKTILEDTKFPRVLEVLKSRDHNVLFVQPDTLSLGLLRPVVRSVWLWKSLFDGGKPIDQLRSSQCVDNTSACCSDQSGSSEDVASKLERKKRRKIRADTDSKV